MVKTIGRQELKAKLDRGDDFKLVMTMHESYFQAEHIPGSIWIDSKEKAAELLRPGDEIVVYCSDPACFISRMVATLLEKAGYEHVYHYEGGLRQWAEAGYPLEGTRWGERMREVGSRDLTRDNLSPDVRAQGLDARRAVWVPEKERSGLRAKVALHEEGHRLGRKVHRQGRHGAVEGYQGTKAASEVTQ